MSSDQTNLELVLLKQVLNSDYCILFQFFLLEVRKFLLQLKLETFHLANSQSRNFIFQNSTKLMKESQVQFMKRFLIYHFRKLRQIFSKFYKVVLFPIVTYFVLYSLCLLIFATNINIFLEIRLTLPIYNKVFLYQLITL